VRKSHNTAAFAFLLARIETNNLQASYKLEGTRANLLLALWSVVFVEHLLNSVSTSDKPQRLEP
jgi:hypothetical protein